MKKKKGMVKFGATGQDSRAMSDLNWEINELWLECCQEATYTAS